MTPSDLLHTAEQVMAKGRAGPWPRAAAILARCALEQALTDLWQRRAPGVEQVSTRAQLICLPAYAADEQVAQQANWLWSALSRATHHHWCELAPTAPELQDWIAQTRRVVAALAAQSR